MNGDDFARWLAMHEPAPDEDDMAIATRELCPVLVEASALETQEAYVAVDGDTLELPCGFWQRFERWRRRWRWGGWQ